MFSGKIHCEVCFVRFGQRFSVSLFSMEPVLLDGSSVYRTVRSAVVALQLPPSCVCGSSSNPHYHPETSFCTPSAVPHPCRSLFSILTPSLLFRLSLMYLMNPCVRVSVMDGSDLMASFRGPSVSHLDFRGEIL